MTQHVNHRASDKIRELEEEVKSMIAEIKELKEELKDCWKIDRPGMFSTLLPTLQVVWDATSFKALMTCARYYQYTILEGWRFAGFAVDLEFGSYFASAIEMFKKARIAGNSKEEATIEALEYVIKATWVKSSRDIDASQSSMEGSSETGKPWGGYYEEQWRCTGDKPYRNPAGNRAKCPWSHKGLWHPSPAPNVCGNCTSNIEAQRRWVPGDKVKDRYSLVRLVAGYCDEQPEVLSDGIAPYQFSDGTPAIELSFKLPLGLKSPTDEPYTLSGHFDSIDRLGEEFFISDNKTTKKALNKQYWGQFSPNVQVDIYDFAGSILYPGLGIRGVRIDGAQTMLGGVRFGSQIFYRNEALREELFSELEWWLHQAERYATDNYWPMNRASCTMCPFKIICNKEPASRQGWLEADFKREPWDTTKER